MTGKRRGPVGLGYMPRGGARAGIAHNKAVEAAKEAAASPAAPEPLAPAERTDVRAERVRSAARRSPRFDAAVVAVVTSSAVTILLEAVTHRG